MEPHVLRRLFHLSVFPRLLLAAAMIFFGQSFEPPSYLLDTSAQEPERFERAREIAEGLTVVDELAGADSHLFKLSVTPGHYVRLVVDKKDFQVSATLLSASQQKLTEYYGRRFGPLPLSFVVPVQGPVYLRLSSLEKDPAKRRYQLQIEEVRGASQKDQQVAAAWVAYSEAEVFRAQWDQRSIRAAIAKYSEASAIWTTTGDRREQSLALTMIGECYFILSEYKKALAVYTEAISLNSSIGDQPAELDALNEAGYVQIYMGENQKALRNFEQVLSSLDSHRDQLGVETLRRKARALNNAGEVYYSLSERIKALDYFGRALKIFVEVSDRSGEALALLNLGYTRTDLGDLQKASEHYHRSLELWQAIGDRRGEALSRTAIGGIQTFLGEKQLALDYHGQALRIFQALGNDQGEAATWNGMAQVYEDLNQPNAALESYQRAFQLNERIGHRDFAALSQYYVGRAYQTIRNPERALKEYKQSLRVSRQVGNRKVEAHALRGIGTIYESYGLGTKALEYYTRVLSLYQRIGDRRWQARTLNRIGYVHDTAGNKRQAMSYFGQALSLSRAVEDRREEISTLYNMARSERGQGNSSDALSHISSSVALIESLRLKIVGEQLRTSYFASVQEHYQLYIDLLMQEDQKRPADGFAKAALQASERSRARSLLESLTAQKVETADENRTDLLALERTQWQQLNFKLEAQARLLNAQHTESDTAARGDEIRTLMAAHQEVLDRIRRERPVYATLTQPQFLTAEAIQAEVQEDTVLLEYALGEQRSYVWVVTRRSIEGYELPPQATIEKLGLKVYELLTARQPVANEAPADYRRRVEAADSEYWRHAAELSQMLLGKVAGHIGGKRILIVGDGVLHRIPFDALPEPGSALAGDRLDKGLPTPDMGVKPLVLGHEIVAVPSASVLAALRSERVANVTTSRLIAVLADPVFDKDDSRMAVAGSSPRSEQALLEDAGLYQAMRDVVGEDEAPLARLGSSVAEAQTIVELTQPQERLISTGFDANLESVMQGGLRDFRIIHFATHGLFNDEHPEFSGLILSRVDEQGQPRNGFLRTDRIYDLQLDADLVVLSACRTGLGHHVNGEGILGVTRAFMDAGSRSVVASLWKVNDEATAEMMRHFYVGMLRDKLTPSAALRSSKEAMWKQERWRSPYFWAAFVMQGKYDQQPPVIRSTAGLNAIVLAISIPTFVIAVLLAFRTARRRRSHQR